MRPTRNGATLSGFGRIIGSTTIAGTLDAGQLPNYADVKANSGGAIPAAIPLSGASPGTLTFQGNITLSPTATMIENIDGALVIPGGPGTFDKIVVTGAGATFTAGGTLAPNLRAIVGGNNTYSPAVGTSLVIVNAQSGAAVAGQFAALAQPPSGLAANTRLDVVYGASAITLNVTPLDFSVQAAQAGLNNSAQNVAQALDSERPAPGIAPRGKAKSLFDDLYDDTIAQDDSELLSLSGDGLAGNLRAGLDAFSGFSDTLGARQGSDAMRPYLIKMAQADSPLPASLDDAAGWTLWAQGSGAWSRIGDDGLPGVHNDRTGIVAGADRAFASDLSAGIAFGYAHTRTNSADARSEQDSYAGSLYATWTPGPFDIEGRIAAGPSHISTVRPITVFGVTDMATGSAGGWGGFATAKAGYNLGMGDVALEPFAELTGTTLQRDAYTETTPFGLDFPTQTASRATTALGIDAGTRFESFGVTVMPQLRLAWTHDIGDEGLLTQADLFGAPFDIDAAAPGRDAGIVRADVDAWSSDGLSAYVGYTGAFFRNASSHEVHGGVRLAL